MSILDIRVQKLFVLALVLKVGLSGLGWFLQMPWTLGFLAPLAVMAAYIGLGLCRRDNDVSDEKFADTAYYLGFIFTITSIIFSLFDLPNIGTRIQDIAVRFGAAMVSTVVGLGLRVYLVSFRTDVSDAIRDAEDTLLGATRSFTERLTMSLERLQDFESRVDLAARSSVERINLQIEALSKNHADKLTEFFSDLTARNQDGFTKALDEVRGASSQLAASVDAYAGGMKTHLTSLEARVTSFAAAVGTRLQKTTFPDDFFAKRLEAPLLELEAATIGVAKQVTAAGADMNKTSSTLASSLVTVNEKSAHAEVALDSVLKLAGQQHLVLQTAQGQLNALSELTLKLNSFDGLLTKMAAEIRSGHESNALLSGHVKEMVQEAASSREAIASSLRDLTASLNAQTSSQAGIVSRLDATTAASERLVSQLGSSAEAQATAASRLESSAQLADQFASRFESASGSEGGAADALASLNEKAERTAQMIAEATQRLQEIVNLAKQFAYEQPIAVQGYRVGLHNATEVDMGRRIEVPGPATANFSAPSGGPSNPGLTLQTESPRPSQPIAMSDVPASQLVPVAATPVTPAAPSSFLGRFTK